MNGVKNLIKKYQTEFSLKGISILGCTTPTPQTGVFILALKALGAKISWCSDNRFASDDDVVSYLKSQAISIFAKSNMSASEYFSCMESAIKEVEKDPYIQIADDGCDITRYLVNNQNDVLKRVSGITEQTTCGVNYLKDLYKKRNLNIPSININHCFTKYWFDNYYGIQQSLIQAVTNLGISIPTKAITIFGYGPVGKGAANALRKMGADVYIVEKDLLLLMQAEWDGFGIYSSEEALRNSDICLTATGCVDTISGEMIRKYAKSGLYLGNIGHGTSEYDLAYLENNATRNKISDLIDEYNFPDSRIIYSLCHGALINFIAGSGNPSKVMSLTFTLILLAQVDLYKNKKAYKEVKIYNLAKNLEYESVALNEPELEKRLYLLSEKQKNYIHAD